MDIQLQIKHNIGNTITVPNALKLFAKTYFSSNVLAGVTTLPVDNTADFSTTQLGLLESIGAENAEFVTVSAVPNATSLTVSTTVFPHNRGGAVYLAEYNQIVVEKAATIDGVYSVFGTFNIQATQQFTTIVDAAGLRTAYYKIKLKNSVTGNESDYTSPISASNYDSNSVGASFDQIKKMFGISDSDPIITTDFLLSALNEARNFTNDMMANYKQSWREVFEYPIQLLAGKNYIDLPDNYDYQYTNGKLLSVRYPRINGLSPYPLNYVDKREWNSIAYSLKYSYTVGATLIGATTLYLENVGDFQNTGTIFVSGNDVTEDIMQINYTGVDLSTNTVTGVTGITRAIPAGTQVFAFPTFAQASYYTVWYDEATAKGRVVFNRPVPKMMRGRNVYIDYYKKMDNIDDINVVLPEPYAHIYQYYIKYAIKYRRNNDTKFETDPDGKRFIELMKQWIENHYIGQLPKIITR